MGRLFQMAGAAGDSAQTPTVGLNVQGPTENQEGSKLAERLEQVCKKASKIQTFNTSRLATAHIGTMVILRVDCQS